MRTVDAFLHFFSTQNAVGVDNAALGGHRKKENIGVRSMLMQTVLRLDEIEIYVCIESTGAGGILIRI